MSASKWARLDRSDDDDEKDTRESLAVQKLRTALRKRHQAKKKPARASESHPMKLREPSQSANAPGKKKSRSTSPIKKRRPEPWDKLLPRVDDDDDDDKLAKLTDMACRLDDLRQSREDRRRRYAKYFSRDTIPTDTNIGGSK